MHQQLEIRLQELKAEFDKGQKRLTELETESNTVRNTLLRISGAVQVLEEELERFKQASNGVAAHVEAQ